MKFITLILILMFAGTSVGIVAAAEVSAVTNDIYVVIAGGGVVESTNTPISYDGDLMWMPFFERGTIELSYPIAPEYFLKIKLTDAHGKEVRKSKLGEKYGSKFESLHAAMETRIYPFVTEGSYRDNYGLGGARIMRGTAPKNLFEIKEPGFYTLEIQMQMFRPNPASTNALHLDLFQIPPVRLKVEKPVGSPIEDQPPPPPQPVRYSPPEKKDDCIQNLKEIGYIIRVWSLDHDDRWPFNASTNAGGTMELCSPQPDGFEGNPTPSFKCLFMTEPCLLPRNLVCPRDTARKPAHGLKDFGPENVTYRLRTGAAVNEANPNEILLFCPIDGNTLYCDGTTRSGSTNIALRIKEGQ